MSVMRLTGCVKGVVVLCAVLMSASAFCGCEGQQDRDSDTPEAAPADGPRGTPGYGQHSAPPQPTAPIDDDPDIYTEPAPSRPGGDPTGGGEE